MQEFAQGVDRCCSPAGPVPADRSRCTPATAPNVIPLATAKPEFAPGEWVLSSHEAAVPLDGVERMADAAENVLTLPLGPLR